jgi:pectate disaccharide-lyase
MFHFLRTGKMKSVAVIVISAMLLTSVQPDSVVYANETDNKDTSGAPIVLDASTETKTLSADSITAGTYSAALQLNGFIMNANAEKTVVVDTSNKTSDDGRSFAQRIKLGGTGAADYRSIHFSVSGSAIVAVYCLSSSADAERTLTLYSQDGIAVGSVTAYKSELKYQTISVTAAGEYYLASPSSGVNVYGVIVTPAGSVPEPPERPVWSSVSGPAITGVIQNGPKLVVTFEQVTGVNGADKATVQMLNTTETLIDSVLIGTDDYVTTRTAEFTPEASGAYRFKVLAERNGEVELKESILSDIINFILPLGTPVIKSANCLDGGIVQISWDAVKEANNYIITYKPEGALETTSVTTDKTSIDITGLTVGLNYLFTVKAVRGTEESAGAETSALVSGEGTRAWYFSAFGQGVNTTNNYFSGSAAAGAVTVASEAGKGKLVPASTDGLAFYYTPIDADKENFILSATVNVDSWTYSNGQEGFGLMACDAVGTNGDSSVFWNNSYMNSVTKVEYLWDSTNHKVSDTGEKITMKLGIGAQEKSGVTATNIADGSIVTNINELFRSTMSTLETSCAGSGAGTYNIVGNYQNAQPPTGTIDTASLLTSFRLTIQRDNTGYRLSYTDSEGNTKTKLYYDIDRKALTQIDPDNLYVGFFASRNAKITVTDIKVTTSDPATDPPAEDEDVTYVTPSYSVLSPADTGIADHELVFLANADGVVSITDARNQPVVTNQAVTANTYFKKKVQLIEGSNYYKFVFTPDIDYKPGEKQLLSSYDTAEIEHVISYHFYNRTTLYVTPNGTPGGTGSKNSPLDIYTAVKYVKPGQYIVLAGGTYNLTKTVTVERGIDGTQDHMIYMIADHSNTERPVFKFNQACAGMIFAGDYWYLQGFDVTESADLQKGLQLSGSHCILDHINTYYNGNTGIQLSRYLTADSSEDWPSYNLVLNCTSYGNADRGYEDADGFAAKLTVGNGNVFDGCIGYNNADDGWDLFAKVETGAIGIVVIKNCVAYGNGYLPDGTNAGNGNGFKLGGSSITGYHQLINSISFDNKAKGIDSNSCPDIQVYNSTSFNNGSYNVAFYTSDAPNTDYFADGVISFRTENMIISDNIKPMGSQDNTEIYGKTNYYWDETTKTSYNTDHVTVAGNWFVSLDTDKPPVRNTDGTVNLNGLLVLTEHAPLDAGARMTFTASRYIQYPEDSQVTPVPPVIIIPVITPTVTPTPTPTPLPLEKEDLKDITVNKAASGVTSELLLYSGGTKGKTGQLSVDLPANLQKMVNADVIEYQVTYRSSNPSVADISETGHITAKSVGTTYLVTKVMIGKEMLIFRTRVEVEKARIEFTQTSDTIELGNTATFGIAVYGYDVKDIVWGTTKRKIAVTGKNYGRTSAAVSGQSAGTDGLYVKVQIGNKTYQSISTKITVIKHGKADTKDQIYIVKKGDSLSAIAKKYKCKIADIMVLNQIKDADKIYIGQKLKLPK